VAAWWSTYLWLGLLVLVMICSGRAHADDAQKRIDHTRQNLESVRTRIDSTTAALEEKQQAARELLQQLRKVDRRLKRAAAKLRQTEAKITDLKAEIKVEESALDKGRRQIKSLERQLQQRLVALYKGGDTQALKMLFSSQSPSELVENYTFLQLLVDNDREMLSAYRSAVAVNQKRLDNLAGLKATEEKTVRQQRAESQQLQQARNDKSGLLKKAKKDEVALAELLSELEEKAARLSALVGKLETDKPGAYTEAAGGFDRQKGQLDWPVKGKILTGFGKGVHAELGTQYDSHGIEILVTGQQPIQSVWNGQVVFANAFRGYGNLMIIDHGDGYFSLYAQAAKLLKAVGARVSRGETVAYSGYDGGDTVYFEIRQGGTPENPTAWLRSRP